MNPIYAHSYPITDPTEEELQQFERALIALYICLRKPPSHPLMETLRFLLRRQQLPKYCLLLEEGNLPNRLYFVVSGTVVCTCKTKNGQEVKWITRAGEFILPEKLHSREKNPGTLLLEEGSVLLSISVDQYFQLRDQHPDVKDLVIMHLEQQISKEQEKKIALRVAGSVFYKMLWLIRKWPDCFSLSKFVLASYLDTSREWISRNVREVQEYYEKELLRRN